MPENIISRVKLPSNDIYKVRDKEARHFLNIEEVSGSSPVLVTGGGALENSRLSITVSAAQLQAIADAWSTFTDLAIEFRLQVVSEDGTVGENTFYTWIVADKAVSGTVALTTSQGVPTSGNYYIFTGTAELSDTLKSYPFTLLLNASTGVGVIDFSVSAGVDHTHGLINADGTIDSSSPITIPNLTSDPNKSYGILVNDTANDGLLSPSAITFARDDRNAFLNKDGTWSAPAEGHFDITGTDSVAAKTTSPYCAAQWKGTNVNITGLYTGLSVNYTLDVTGDATYGTVLNINNLGNHPVLSHTGQPIGVTYAAGAVLQLEYDATATADVYIDATTATTVTGCWKLAIAQSIPYYVEGVNSIAQKTSSPYYASRWQGSNPAIKALYTGLVINYKIDVAGGASYGTVLDLNGWGEHPVVRNTNTGISTVYSVGSVVNLVYDADQTANVYQGSGSKAVTGCWKIADYDSVIVYHLSQYYTRPQVNTSATDLYRYQICVSDIDKTLIPVNGVNNKTSQYDKVLTSRPWDPFGPIYSYQSTTTVAMGTSVGSGTLYRVYLADMRYSFNIRSSGGVEGVTQFYIDKPLYIKAKYNKLTKTCTFVQDLTSENYYDRSSLTWALPSSDPSDNSLTENEFYIYIFFGYANSAYQADISVEHTIYYWNTKDNCIDVFSGTPDVDVDVASAVSITYSDLVTLKTNQELAPGTLYRITDYVTKINGTYEMNGAYLHYAKSAEHPYDVIVYAIDDHTLSENARATLHSGDTYFANAKIESWDIKYCLENDTNRFAWADTTSGKGVVYYMKDEWGNEGWYDFKNTLYLRYALQSEDANFTDLAYNNDSNSEDYQPNRYGSVYQIFDLSQENIIFGNKYSFAVGNLNILGVFQEATVDNTYLTTYNAGWYYTFDYNGNDATLISSFECLNNKFECTTDLVCAYLGTGYKLGLPGITFENYRDNSNWQIKNNSFADWCSFTTFGDCATSNKLDWCCYANTFGNNCDSNIFGNACYSNTFDDNCHSNIFGKSCYSNTFGYNCYLNTFKYSCDRNIFNKYCNSNIFEANCDYNTFGINNYSNTFGNSCDSNIFDSYCNFNTFAYNCNSNTFGVHCRSNAFRDNCYNNTFGDYCSYNIFGESSYYNILGNNCESNIFKYTCTSNTIGSNCDSNSLEDYCSYNSFGNNCSANSFRNNCQYNILGKTNQNNNELDGYIRDCKFGSFIKYITLTADTLDNSHYGRSYTILDSVQGVNNNRLIIAMSTYLSTYSKVPETYVGYKSDGTTLRIWVPADTELETNKVTSISSSSTDVQYPSAKLVYNQLALKEDVSNKVTSLSASSTDTEYPSAKAVYDITKPKLYTATIRDDLSDISRPTTVSTFREGSTSDVIADVNAGEYVIIRITDGQRVDYDFVYIGYTTAHTFRYTHNNSYIDLEFDSSNPPVATIGQHADTFEVISNRVTSLSASDTNLQYPSARAVYNAINNSISDKLKYITITPISGAWDASEGTYSCTISAADYTKINSAWSTDDFCVKTTVNFPGANSTTIPVSFTLFKALTTTFENIEYYVFNAHYTGSTELDLEFADYDSFIFCISKAGAAGEAHSCLGFVHQGTTETDVINIINTRLANYVDLTTNQTINGVKTFNSRPLSADTYTRLTYLQSNYDGVNVTDFAYIDSDVLRGRDWTNKLTTVLDGYFVVSQSLGFCGYDAGGQIGQSNGKWSTEGGVSTVNCVGVENRATVTQVIDFTAGKDTLYIGGNQITQRATSSASSYSTTYTYPIFVAANSTGPTYRPAALVLYSFKMYDDSDNLIRDYIPVRTALGQLGLLDQVSNTFYPKKGSGTFTAGPDSTTVVITSPLLTAADLAPVALSNDYNDLINKPTIPATGRLNTNNSTALTPNSSEAFTGNIALHKIAKTGTYADLLSKPGDGSATIASVANDIVTLKAGVTQSTLTISNSSGTDITLAKVAKTGAYSDLSGTPTIPSAPGTLNTTATTSQATSASEALSGNITLHKVSKTGDYDDLVNKPTIDNRVVIKCILDSTTWSNFLAIWNNATQIAAPLDFTYSSNYVAGLDSDYRTKLMDIYGNDKEGILQVFDPSENAYFEYSLSARGPMYSGNYIEFWGCGVTISKTNNNYPVRFNIAILLDISNNDPPEDNIGVGYEIPGGLISSSNVTGLATVATTGSYSDLSNLPSYTASDLAASKTITALTQTNGVISATAAYIAIDSIQTTRKSASDVTIAASDALPIFDASDDNKLKGSLIFDGTTTNQFLSKKGTWESPPTITVDSALSTTSENPVQNKVIDAALKTKVDLTSDQTIAGEKTFAERPRVSLEVTLPSGYTQLDYIKGDGTAYINTGKKYNTSNTVFLDFRQVNTSNYRIWGTFGQQSYVGPNVSMTYSNGWMVRQETVANQARGVGLPAIDTKRHSVWIQSNGNIIFDGTDYGVSAGWAANYQFNFNTYLFTINPGGTTPSATFNGEIYHYRVWDNNGILIQDMYPVKYTSGSTTTYGMYDIVENTYYPNANSSGAFTSGSTGVVDSVILVESDLAPVALSGSYNDLTNKPTIPTVGILNTNNADAQSVNSSESLSGTVKLHKVAKTGSFGDLLNRPNVTVSGLATSKTITSLTQTNGTIAATAADIAITSTQVSSGVTVTATSGDSLAIFDADDNGKLKSGLTFNSTHNNQYLRKDGTWATTPATTVGSLSISSSGQTVPSSAESFTGSITLHKVAKTGSFSDLSDKPSTTISGLATNKTLTALTQSDGTISATAANIAITSDQVTANSTAATIATGDALIIADSSNNYKLAKTSIVFDATSANRGSYFLREDGTWVDINTVIPAPMQFKGTVGGSHGTYTWANLPSASSENTGWTLKVLEAHSGIPTCKIGDTIISDGTMWVVIPSGDEPSGTVTSVALSEGSGITITGEPITTSGVITVAHGNTSDVPDTNNSGRTYIQNISFDDFGHVLSTTSATETVTIPANNVTGSGTSGSLVKFNGANTITDGPALGSDTTTFLRNDGTWATPTDTNDKVKQLAAPSQAPEPTANPYSVLIGYSDGGSEETNYVRKSTLTYNQTTKALSTGGGTVDGYDLNAASEKAVDTTIAAGSTSGNLPTSQAVASFVENKGYVTTNTTYTFVGGTNQFTVTPSGGQAQTVTITPSIPMDTVVSDSSTNAVQNSAIYAALPKVMRFI